MGISFAFAEPLQAFKHPTPPAWNPPMSTQIPTKSVPVDHIASNMMRMGSMMFDANSGLPYDDNENAIEDIKRSVEFVESAVAAAATAT